MACPVFKYLIFAALLSLWQSAQGTRFQPSIIWDIYNKLISCKCNWLKIPKLDNYDRIELLCPSQILVSSTREHDVAKIRQYYNIFMRKFNKTKHTLDELRESLYNGSFCDPTSNETKKLYTCHRDDPEGSAKLRFHEQEDLHVGDIAVFFCNKGTGLQSDLDSADKKCKMVFITNVTAYQRKDYDLSYGKCLLPSDSNCDNIKQDCPCKNSTTSLSGNETTIAPVVASFTSLPERVVLGTSLTIICAAVARPSPSYTIVHNGTVVVSTNKTYAINPVEYSHAGSYKCIAKNRLGNDSMNYNFTVVGKETSRTSNGSDSGNEWYIYLVLLVSGVITGIFLSYIFVYFRPRLRGLYSRAADDERQNHLRRA